MSSTDQAFIRAYGNAAGSSRSVPIPAPAASADLVDGLLSQPAAAWLETRRLDVGTNQPIWTVHESSIDVGLSSAVPAPHFLQHAPSSVAAASHVFAAADASADNVRSQHSREASVAAPPHRAFGRSPKVTLSDFVNGDFDSLGPAPPRPAFEIDAVRWPTICQMLLDQCGSRFSQLADDLRQEVAEGRKVLAVSGLGRGEGRTTLTLCLAKQLTAARIRVALVDADFSSPSVASRLSISAECGWESALCGERSVWDAMIEAAADRLSIVPLSAAHFADNMPRPVYGIAAVLADLAEQFDVVLVDAGPLTEGDAANWLLDPAAGVQSVVLAHDARRHEPSQLAAACLQLAEAGVRQFGIAEVFGTQN